MHDTSRTSRALLALACGGFGIGLTEFVIMGLLPDVAQALNVSIPEAGHLISAYAFGVVVGAPTLVFAARRTPPKRLLIGLMTLFTIFNGLSALAPGYITLLSLRFLSGLPHGAYFGVGAVVAAKLAGPGRAASAFAVMLAGLTIANVVGVPIATYVGHALSWRAAFGLVAGVGVVTVAAIASWVPSIADHAETEAANPLEIFRRPRLWLAILVTAIGFGGFFSWFSYIAPLLKNETQLGPEWVPWMMALAGLGMTAGNSLGGWLSDRLTPIRAIILLMFAMTIVLCLNAWAASSVWAMVPLVFITGANAMAMGAPLQMLLISASTGAEVLGSSVGQAAFNVGNTLGAFLAGLPLAAGYPYYSADLVGATLSGGGVLLALAIWRSDRRRN